MTGVSRALNRQGTSVQCIPRRILVVIVERNGGRPKRSWEKDLEDWIWRLGRTAEYRLMYGRSIKPARSGNGLGKERESESGTKDV